MKYSLLIILFFQSFNSPKSQTIEGIYEDGLERLEFYSDSIYFLIGTNGGLIYPIVGYGKYTFLDSFLIIENRDSILVSMNLKLNPPEWYSESDYLIYADKGFTIFSINQISNCSINCILLSYGYKLKTNVQKSLRKLLRNVNRDPYSKGRDRTYKKARC